MKFLLHVYRVIYTAAPLYSIGDMGKWKKVRCVLFLLVIGLMEIKALIDILYVSSIQGYWEGGGGEGVHF